MINKSRNEILTEWCDCVSGRQSKLGEMSFPHHSYPRLSISNYKSAKRKISDDLWDELVTNMMKIEYIESKSDIQSEQSSPKITNKEVVFGQPSGGIKSTTNWMADIHDATYDLVRQSEFVKNMNDWLESDRVAKLRMIDLAYVLNYDNSIDKDLNSKFVSNIVKNKTPVGIDIESNIHILMKHVDKLISENHVFYIAASQNVDAYS